MQRAGHAVLEPFQNISRIPVCDAHGDAVELRPALEREMAVPEHDGRLILREFKLVERASVRQLAGGNDAIEHLRPQAVGHETLLCRVLRADLLQPPPPRDHALGAEEHDEGVSRPIAGGVALRAQGVGEERGNEVLLFFGVCFLGEKGEEQSELDHEELELRRVRLERFPEHWQQSSREHATRGERGPLVLEGPLANLMLGDELRVLHAAADVVSGQGVAQHCALADSGTDLHEVADHLGRGRNEEFRRIQDDQAV
eukprot:3558099-Rhodomonas_salina.2